MALNPIGTETMAGLPSGKGAAVLGDQTIGERMLSTIEEKGVNTIGRRVQALSFPFS
jgi:hypothetical protein